MIIISIDFMATDTIIVISIDIEVIARLSAYGMVQECWYIVFLHKMHGLP